MPGGSTEGPPPGPGGGSAGPLGVPPAAVSVLLGEGAGPAVLPVGPTGDVVLAVGPGPGIPAVGPGAVPVGLGIGCDGLLDGVLLGAGLLGAGLLGAGPDTV